MAEVSTRYDTGADNVVDAMQILVWYTQDFSAQYIDDFDELPYDVDVIRHHVERITYASAPWQAWAMDVRSVYRWENPSTTLKWLAVYVVLWYTDHIFGFLVGFKHASLICVLNVLVCLHPLYRAQKSVLLYFYRIFKNVNAAGA